MNKFDIFVSYSRHDADYVLPIVKRLEKEGFSVWIDQDGIESGDAFKRIIVKAIENSSVVLFFSSASSNRSSWTAKEIGVAIYEEKTIIPIKLDKSKYSSEVKFDLINLDYIEAKNNTLNESDFTKLFKTLRNKCTRNNDKSSNNLSSQSNITESIENRIIKDTIPNIETKKETVSSQTNITNNDVKDNKTNLRNSIKNKVNTILVFLNQNRLLIIWIVVSFIWAVISCTILRHTEILFFLTFILCIAFWCFTICIIISCIITKYKRYLNVISKFLLISLLLSIACLGLVESNTAPDLSETATIKAADSEEIDAITAQSDNPKLYDDSIKMPTSVEELKSKGDLYFNNGQYANALTCYKELSEQGEAYGLYMIGKMHYNGLGVKKDYKYAAQMYAKAAEKDFSEAFNSLGVCYLKGRGVNQDYDKAADLFFKAANLSNPVAQCNLADCYLYGNGVQQDNAKALEWFEKAASLNYAPAIFNLGRIYYNGIAGKAKDYKKAVMYFEKAAIIGMPEAQNSLGICYLKGHGKERSNQLAVYWFEKAVAQGHITASYNLGNCYRDGSGVKKDKSKARELYEFAASQGSTSAIEALKNL